jgi:Ca-activated chloride channel homolog
MRRLGLVLLLAAGGWDALRAPDPDVDKGNQAYRDGRYDQALGHFRSAEERGVDPRLHFDKGAALYKLGEKATDEEAKAELYKQAEEEFRRAADTEDAALKSSAYYNLGNTMYQRQRWEDAIGSYKRALLADPKNDAARHNLEMALRQREKQEKQEQQQQGKQGKQGQRGQQKDQQRPGQGQQGQEPDQPPPDQQKPPDQPKQPDQQDPQGQPQPEQQPPQQPPPQGQPDQGQADQGQAGREPAQTREEERQGESPESDSPSDQERKLDELERRSRDLRKRLLRQGARQRDPLRLPSRRDW